MSKFIKTPFETVKEDQEKQNIIYAHKNNEIQRHSNLSFFSHQYVKPNH